MGVFLLPSPPLFPRSPGDGAPRAQGSRRRWHWRRRLWARGGCARGAAHPSAVEVRVLAPEVLIDPPPEVGLARTNTLILDIRRERHVVPQRRGTVCDALRHRQHMGGAIYLRAAILPPSAPRRRREGRA